MEAQELDIGPLPEGGAVAMDTFQGRSRQKGDNSVRGQASGGPPRRVTGQPSRRAPTSFPRRCSQHPIRQDSTCHHGHDICAEERSRSGSRTQRKAMEESRASFDSVPTDHTSYFSPSEGSLTFPSYRASRKKQT